MHILLIEPYFTGSHAAWAEGYKKHSSHQIEILSLSGHYWKWRMHGGAVTMAHKFMVSNNTPDLVLATDMLDLTTFLALTRQRTAEVPCAIYFHENQLTYPWSPTDRDIQKERDHHYGFINYSSALAADKVFFNSQFHRESFLTELPKFLKNFPDQHELASVETIRQKSSVLALGMDLSAFDPYKDEVKGEKPLILWNHRWEYDKNPSDLFTVLCKLADKGLDFEVAILGENFSRQPSVFDQAKEKLGHRVVQFGFVRSFEDYARWLWRADVLPVTSNQDFFGGSAVEAMYCNTYPILPDRLGFPEHIPADQQQKHLYDEIDELENKLESALQNIETIRQHLTGNFVRQYCWEELTPRYDKELGSVSSLSHQSQQPIGDPYP